MNVKTPSHVDAPPQVHFLPEAQVLTNPRNARIHTPRQLAAISRSLLEFGWTSPALIDSNNMLIAGHARIAAARQIWTEGVTVRGKVWRSIQRVPYRQVPVLKLSQLTPTQARAYMLADNKLADLAEWDHDLLATEIRALQVEKVDFDALGFNSKDIESLLGAEGDTDADKDFGEREFLVVVTCADEDDQKRCYETLAAAGFADVKVLE